MFIKVLSLLLLGLIFYSTGTAQVDVDSQIRVRFSEPNYNEVVGRFVSIRYDTLVLNVETGDAPTELPLSAVSRIEVNRGRELNLRGGLEGAVIGLAIGSIVLVPSMMESEDVVPSLIFASFTTALGGGLGLGGKKSRKGALIGLIAGLVAGRLIGVIVESQKDTEGVAPIAGMAIFAVTGSLIGISVGIIKPGERWQKITFDKFGSYFAPLQDRKTVLYLSCAF